MSLTSNADSILSTKLRCLIYLTLLLAAGFFLSAWMYYVREKNVRGRKTDIHDGNLTDEERANLINNAQLFCPALYLDFSTDQSYQYLCLYDVLLGMKYYRVEFLPLILEVVQRRDEKERIIASLHRHIAIEQAVLQLGKNLERDRPENATFKGRPDPDVQKGWAQVYKQYGEYSLESEYSLTD